MLYAVMGADMTALQTKHAAEPDCFLCWVMGGNAVKYFRLSQQCFARNMSLQVPCRHS